MKVKNKSAVIALLLMAVASGSQASNGIDMADTMRSEGKIYVVIAVIAIIFAGLALYLFYMDNKIGKLEKALKEKQK